MTDEADYYDMDGGGDGDDDIVDDDDDVGSEGGSEQDSEEENSGNKENESDAEAEEEDEVEGDDVAADALIDTGDDANDDISHFKSINDKLKSNKIKTETSRYLTKYEKAAIIGRRAQQIDEGAPVSERLVKWIEENHIISSVKIAEKEFFLGECPLTINRHYPNGKTICIPVSHLIDVIPAI